MWNIRKVISKGDYKYALVPEHPNATKNGYVLIHRVIVENHIGRLLRADEIVHHKDGNKFNNDISNLEVLSASQHATIHGLQRGAKYGVMRCPQCGAIFERLSGNTSPYKHSRATFCSRSCAGKFNKYAQLHGLTDEMKKAIDNNFIKFYTKHKI